MSDKPSHHIIDMMRFREDADRPVETVLTIADPDKHPDDPRRVVHRSLSWVTTAEHLALALDEIARLKAIVDKSAKTADGKVIELLMNCTALVDVVGNQVIHDDVGVVGITEAGDSGCVDVTVRNGHGEEWVVPNDRVWSTLQAAEAATNGPEAT